MSIFVDVKKDYEGFSLNVEFEAENGVTGLLGASGCGKSITLKCIAGIVRPDKGRIVVDNTVLYDSVRRIDLPPQKRRVGLLFQNYALFPNLTVEQNILSIPALHRRKDRKERFADLVDRFHIGGLEKRYPSQLSGGQQQRAALARIMASEPAAVLLDEPLSALDSYLRWQLEGELAQILEGFEGVALYVSHNRDEVYRLCSKVCVMNEGSNEKFCTVRELFENPGTLASSLLTGCKNYSRIERLNEHLLCALDWGTELRCETLVGDGIRYIGVHSHRVERCAERGEENVFPCRVVRVARDIFSTLVVLQPLESTSSSNFARIRMELPHREVEPCEVGDVICIRIKPVDVMLLQ